MDGWMELLALVPEPLGWSIDWSAWKASVFQPFFAKMAATGQNPGWHGEGDVWTHTQMVCEELAAMRSFRALSKRRRQEVFLAALLHDIGKIVCTKLEDGCLISPNHTVTGAKMAREFLRNVCGPGSTQDGIEFRETVCSLIRYHSVPAHILDQKEPELKILKIAANGELMKDFTMDLLCILEEADMRGRIHEDVEGSVETVRLCAGLAEELGCRKAPFSFPSPYAEHAYLSGRNLALGQDLYDDTWGEVILMSGLPGTGKDTWIREHLDGLPTVSLDVFRKEMHVLPQEPQGPVAAAAREKAKEYLRRQEPFVWNATNVTPALREKQIRLFQAYHASVRIVYLETGWGEQLLRNKNRAEAVPEEAIGRMMKNLVLPERYEAERVEWISV